VGTETCTLVTTFKSGESEKGSNDSESSSSETETETGMEAFPFVRMVFYVRRTGDSAFLCEDHFFKCYDRDRQTL
jgi:hypothetical protein